MLGQQLPQLVDERLHVLPHQGPQVGLQRGPGLAVHHRWFAVRSQEVARSKNSSSSLCNMMCCCFSASSCTALVSISSTLCPSMALAWGSVHSLWGTLNFKNGQKAYNLMFALYQSNCVSRTREFPLHKMGLWDRDFMKTLGWIYWNHAPPQDMFN